MPPIKKNVQHIFQEYEFKRLISRLPSVNSSVDEDNNNAMIDASPLFFETSFSMIESQLQLEQLLPLLKKGFAFDLETTSLDPQNADIVAVSISASVGVSFVVDCRLNAEPSQDLFNLNASRNIHPLFELLIPLLENPSVPKILHNAKYEFQVLHYHDIALSGIYFDTMIAAYLLDSRQSVGLKSLVKANFNHDMVDFDALLSNHDSIYDVDINDLANYVAVDSSMTFYLYERFDGLLVGELRSLFLSLKCR